MHTCFGFSSAWREPQRRQSGPAISNKTPATLLQLLEHGADVHNHGPKSYQTPLRMAVTELNMDVGMVDLLVSHGASPFLEAKDGKHSAC